MLKSDRFGMEKLISYAKYKGGKLVPMLKSDRFGMEKIFSKSSKNSLYQVKIRPFRYGKSLHDVKQAFFKLVKIRPFRYGKFPVLF